MLWPMRPAAPPLLALAERSALFPQNGVIGNYEPLQSEVSENPTLRELRRYFRFGRHSPAIDDQRQRTFNFPEEVSADCTLSDESRLPNVHSSG
jgi:hypothetical protein